MAFQLVVVRGRSVSQVIKLGATPTVVGRQDGCQLQIRSSQVSRKHCEIFEKQGLLLVKDLNSSNGTLVNGDRIAEQRVLEPGDELTIGPVKFRVEKAGAPAAAGARSAPGDTAVPEAVTVGAEDLIELDESGVEEPTTIASRKPDSRPTIVTSKPAGTPEPAPSEPEPAPEPEPEPESEPGNELSEDAVAEFLFGLDVDEDDKS